MSPGLGVLPRHDLYLPPILRLHPEVGGMFVDHMDLVSLLRWRLTCKINYDQSTGALRRTLLFLLRRFVPFPSTLRDMVTQSRAIFGGEVALAFLLRDPSYTPSTLEIYASEFEFCGLRDAIFKDPFIGPRIESHFDRLRSHSFALRRLMAQTLTLSMTNGRTIYIHRSYTISPAAPLTRNPCTALCNFVTAYSFGCSHPLLTLRRRALLADAELNYLLPVDADTLNKLETHRFTMAVSPAAWPDLRFPDASSGDGVALPVALSPQYHESTFTGFVAGDGDRASAAAEHEYALHVGLAQAAFDVADTDEGATDGDTGGGLHATGPPSAREPPGIGLGLERSLSTIVPSVQSGSPEVDSPPSAAHADRETSPVERDVGAYLEITEDGSDCGPSSPTQSGSDYLDREPPHVGSGSATSLAALAVEGVSPSLYQHVDSPVMPAVMGSPNPDALALSEDADPSISANEDAHAISLALDIADSEGDTDVSDTSTSTDAEDVARPAAAPLRCLRHLYICPAQGHFFGDKGSFVDFLDPLRGGERACMDNNIAPYGSMVVWRIMSSFDCDESCEYFDNVLEEGVTSIPVMFKRDPYGELRDVVSDRRMPVPRRARSPCRKRSNSV